MGLIMTTANFYIIENNLVTNVVVLDESVGVQHNLKRAFVTIPNIGVVAKGWTYLPDEDTFLPPPRNILAEWAEVRRVRDTYLVESDLYVMPDRWAAYNQDEQNAWAVYRKALRDIPQNFIDPKEVVWPQKPWVESMESIKPSDPINPEV